MEINPIAGVRAVSLHRRPKAESMRKSSFAIEASERADDACSNNEKLADSSLDEVSVDEMQEQEPGSTEPEASSSGNEDSTINVIA
jgi:hypothetical protein